MLIARDSLPRTDASPPRPYADVDAAGRLRPTQAVLDLVEKPLASADALLDAAVRACGGRDRVSIERFQIGGVNGQGELTSPPVFELVLRTRLGDEVVLSAGWAPSALIGPALDRAPFAPHHPSRSVSSMLAQARAVGADPEGAISVHWERAGLGQEPGTQESWRVGFTEQRTRERDGFARLVGRDTRVIGTRQAEFAVGGAPSGPSARDLLVRFDAARPYELHRGPTVFVDGVVDHFDR